MRRVLRVLTAAVFLLAPAGQAWRDWSRSPVTEVRKPLAGARGSVRVSWLPSRDRQGAVRFEPVRLAYIGPGAGFAFIGSFLTLIAGFFLSMLSLLLWPFRLLYQAIRQRQGFKHARIKKLIFLGLDGFDPGLTER